MRKRKLDGLKNHTMTALALAAAGQLAVAATAGAGTLYHWETEDGTVAYADDWKRVPEKYRDQVSKRETQSLDGYSRYTPQPAAASAEYAARLSARLEHLNELNAPATAAVGTIASDSGQSRILLQTGSAAVPAIDVAAEDTAEPVVVETRRYKEKGRIVTRHNTTVTQGGKLVAVIKQESREAGPSADIHSEADLP